MERIAESDIVVTSFYHVEEVRKRLSHLGRPIVGISLEPDIATIVRVAKIPKQSTVGIVTTSEDFRAIIRETLASLELDFARVLESTSRDEEAVRGVVERCDALLVSPQRRQRVAEMAREGVEVIEFVFSPDRTSVNNLKVALLELQHGRG
jgi:GntR family transcriptional regulator